MSLLDTASLIVTPNGYKEGKLYSVIPSDGSGDMSVTRATTATRVNSQGLVELVPYNLLQYSEQFNNAAWGKFNGVTVTANSTTAPDGTLTADTLSDLAGASLVRQYANVTAGSTYTFSVWLKKASGAPLTRLRVEQAQSPYNSTIVEVSPTDEWVRYSVTRTVEAGTTSLGCGIFPDVNIGDSVYAWGAQLVEGSVAKDYQKTETRLNIPRLDYSNGTCPSLLVEPQRTNSCLYSENISTGWTYTNTAISVDQTASPSGVANADAIIPNATSGQHAINSTNITASGSFTLSAFVKAGEYTKVAIRESANTGSYASFNLATGTKIEDNVSGASFIESYGNGWYRIGVTGTFSGTVRLGINVLSNAYTTGNPSSGTTFFSGNSSDKLFCWGMQCELGATYATSYIPTTSASVTRNADNIELLNSAILPTSYPFTMFVDAKYSSLLSFFPLSFLNTAANDNYFAIRFQSGRVDALIRPSTTEIALLSPSIFTEGQAVRVAVKVESASIKLFVNGQLQASATNTVLFNAAINDLFIGRLRSLSDTNTRLGLNAAAIWDTALTDTECQTLTTV